MGWPTTHNCCCAGERLCNSVKGRALGPVATVPKSTVTDKVDMKNYGVVLDAISPRVDDTRVPNADNVITETKPLQHPGAKILTL